MHCDYAEPIQQEKNLEIQSDHFGYVTSCSIKGVCVWSPLPNAVEECDAGLISKVNIQMMQFHLHLLDMSKQDASTTHTHMICLQNKLCGTGEVKTTILYHSDGCSKQYRCGTALYLFSDISIHFGVTVDCMIGAPGHGKDVVDALNATTKKFIKQKMCMLSNPGNERETESTSFARECLRLCAADGRKDGVNHQQNMPSARKLPTQNGITISKKGTTHV
jgi:hypothetical protein